MAQDGPWEAIAAMRPGELRPQDEPPGGYDRWADAKLPPGDRYYYRIYACTPVGGTVYSNVVSGVVPDVHAWSTSSHRGKGSGRSTVLRWDHIRTTRNDL